MSLSYSALLIGGLLPAILYGVGNVLVKAAERAGMGPGPLMLIAGISITVVGLIAYIVLPDKTISLKSGSLAVTFGVAWAVGSLCVAIALTRFNAPVSQLVPIYNTNTLVAVIIGLIIFSEWKEVQISRLLIGAGLILLGSVLVVRS